jgi:LacI family transcriptional regulator
VTLRPNQKITLKFLSEHLGLSRTTISVVLNNSPIASTIAPKTRERIVQAAKEFDYKPNFFARYLNQGRSYLIGILSPDLAEGYDATVLAGIEQYLLDGEYHFFVASHQWSESRIRRTAQLFQERGAEGVILVNSDYFPEINLPVVRIGRHEPPAKGTSLILDNHAGIRKALEYLVSLGHRKIAFIKGHTNSSDTEDRWHAVVEAARDLGIRIEPHLVVQLERLGTLPMAHVEEGARCAQKLLPHQKSFTALLAFNDISAIGAINCFREAGLGVPRDVSVVGFDDVAEASITYPPLTTVRQPLRQMGEMAARQVIEAITNGSQDQQILFSPELIVRSSTAPLRTKRAQRA